MSPNAIESLPPRLATSLLKLKGAAPDAIAATVALWPFGYRAALEAHGLIRAADDPTLTATGREALR